MFFIIKNIHCNLTKPYDTVWMKYQLFEREIKNCFNVAKLNSHAHLPQRKSQI